MPTFAASEKAQGSTSEERRLRTTGHIPALDGVRGIAILSVILFHFHFYFSRASTGAEKLLFEGLYFGWAGVDLFFALSGFLITGILLDSVRSHRYFFTFYARRSLRIFPLYFAFLLGAILLFSGTSHAVKEKIWYFLYLQNWTQSSTINPAIGHLWSLAVEEQFYLVWPVLIWFTPKRRLPTVFIALAITSAVSRIYLGHIGQGLLVYESTLTRMDGLILGGLAAFALRDERWRKRFRRSSAVVALASFLVVISVFFIAGNMDYSSAFVDFGALPLAVLFSTLIFRIAALRAPNFLSYRWLQECGKKAYAMYLFHSPITFFAAAKMQNALQVHHVPGSRIFWGLLYMIAMTLVTYFLAVISGVLFEAPINRLKKHFVY